MEPLETKIEQLKKQLNIETVLCVNLLKSYLSLRKKGIKIELKRALRYRRFTKRLLKVYTNFSFSQEQIEQIYAVVHLTENCNRFNIEK